MPKYFLLDAGNQAIVIDGVTYEYVDQRLGLPSLPFTVDDHINVGGMTYDNADAQGKTVYTAGERAYALYTKGNGDTGFTGTFNTWVTLMTVPEAGVLRLWNTVKRHSIRINGGADLGQLEDTEAQAQVYNVNQGDLIETLLWDWYSPGLLYYSLSPFAGS